MPPCGTESVCEPTTIVGNFRSVPSRRPIRLPAASIRTSRPAASIRLLTYTRPAISASLYAILLTPPSGFAPKRASSVRCCCTRVESADGASGCAAAQTSSGQKNTDAAQINLLPIISPPLFQPILQDTTPERFSPNRFVLFPALTRCHFTRTCTYRAHQTHD